MTAPVAALAIISGILVSVVVAFVAGTVVQYICRLIFTFDFDRVYKKFGGIFGGFSDNNFAQQSCFDD